MRKSILILCLSLLALAGTAQNTNIGGTINKYSKVTEVIRCGNRIIVDSPSLFAVGMQALIIQMQGASIDQSNSSAYGNVTSYASAGNYEIQTIDSILGDTIKFKYQIERIYDPSGSLQLMPLPVYNKATVTSKLTCKQWNGSIGGVLLLKADSLVLNDSIKVSGLGFRGYYSNDSSQLCFGNLTDYFYSDSMHAGPKGEGIVLGPYNYGRGKNVNGGGGGDNENTGGGGGSNYGKGGSGGTIVPRTGFCNGNGPGDGGQALKYNDTLNKVFLGGGGGCGHGNNSEGTPGVNGGGIIIIIANTLVGNNKGIVANGLDQTRIAGSDGAGGGGGGGTILLSVGQYIGNVGISAKGGAGGKLNNDNLTRSCMGPAGGGGGGTLWVSQPSVPANISFTAAGGANGLNLGTGSTFCPYGVTNGALPGDTGGSVTGLVIPISTTPYLRLSATASRDSLLCNDQQITLSASGFSSDTVYYHWSTGLQTSSISFLATHSSVYTVTVTDFNTCTIIKNVNLTVDIVAPAFSGDTSLCTPSNLVLHADNPGTTVVTYGWNTGAATPSISIFADSSRTYTVTVTSVHNCIATDTIHVSVGNLNVTYSPDTVICAGDSVVIGVFPTAGGTYSYTWSGGQSTATIRVSPGADSTYTVIASAGGACVATHQIHVAVQSVIPAFTHDTAICTGSRVTLHADNTTTTQVSYMWSTGATSPSITVSPTAPQRYTVTVTTPHGCSATDSIHVNVGNLSVTFSDDTFLCPGNSAQLMTNVITGNNVSYTWNTGDNTPSITVTPTRDMIYDVTVSDDAGCRAAHSYVVTQDFLAIFISDDTTICPGGSATLIATVPNVSTLTYLWSDQETTPQISVTDTTRQLYSVTVTSGNGCIGTATVHVYIDSVYIGVSRDTTICPNSAATLHVSASGIGSIVYAWSTGQSGPAISVSPATNQVYHVTATDSLGCAADTSTFITADNNATNLTIQIIATPDSSYGPGDSVQLSVAGRSLSHYLWTPGATLSDSTVAAPIATPLRAVQYCVAVADSSGCTASDCKEIEVGTPPATIAISTAFTPNGDGVNDVYKVVPIDGTAITSVSIYNRWGEMVYENQGSAGWDGLYKGTMQPSEIYTCYVTYYQKIYPERLFHKMGTFTLLR